MNIGVHRFFWIGVLGFLGYNPSSGIAGSKGSSIFSFLRRRGIVVRGVYRSYYKGHKDKIKGEVEVEEGGGIGWGGVEGWGENADNCN